MATLTDIRAALDQTHPTLTARVNGEQVVLSPAERAALLDEWAQAAYDRQQAEAAAAARKVWPDAAAFVAAFSPLEIVTIARSTDDTLTYLDYVLKTWQGPLYFDDPRVQAAFARLLSLGILTEERVSQILAK